MKINRPDVAVKDVDRRGVVLLLQNMFTYYISYRLTTKILSEDLIVFPDVLTGCWKTNRENGHFVLWFCA